MFECFQIIDQRIYFIFFHGDEQKINNTYALYRDLSTKHKEKTQKKNDLQRGHSLKKTFLLHCYPPLIGSESRHCPRIVVLIQDRRRSRDDSLCGECCEKFFQLRLRSRLICSSSETPYIDFLLRKLLETDIVIDRFRERLERILAWHHKRDTIRTGDFFSSYRSGHCNRFWGGYRRCHRDWLSGSIASKNIASKLAKAVVQRFFLCSRNQDRCLNHRGKRTKLSTSPQLLSCGNLWRFDTLRRKQRPCKPDK